MSNVLVLLKGGHKSLIRDTTVSEVEDVLTKARQCQRQVDSPYEFVYLQSSDTDESVNRVAVDPFAVVAIIAI